MSDRLQLRASSADPEFERRVSFTPAFERRHDDPARDYGIGCVKALFVLIGPEGAVSFEVFTGWYLPHVRERLRRETDHRPSAITGTVLRCSLEGHGGAMFTHDAKRRRDYYDTEPGDCDFAPGGKCWGDVGYLIGDTLFDTLVEGGDEALWAALREQYDAMVAPEEVNGAS